MKAKKKMTDKQCEDWIQAHIRAHHLGLLSAWKIKCLEAIPGWDWTPPVALMDGGQVGHTLLRPK